MTKNIWAGDLALIELAAGRTDAPRDVLDSLAAKGHVKLTAKGGPVLTGAGKHRAASLKGSEHDLRLMFGPGSGSAIKGVGGSGFRAVRGPQS